MIPNELFNEIKNLLRANERKEGNFLYTVPSPDTYPYQWLWDSCFHAIIYSHFDAERAKEELRSLLSEQLPNGMIPHMIYWKRVKETIDIDWGQGERRSTITQPPMLAYAAWQIYESDADIAFLQEIYPSLFHYYKYLINERDPHERGLIGLINPDESGEDNSPRFDALLGLPPQHTWEENLAKRIGLVRENAKCNFDAPFCMKNFFWVKDVPFNAIMIKNLEALSSIASKVDRGYDASYFDRSREEMISAMRELMLEDRLFWSTYGEEYNKIKVKTWAIFSPLFAKILTQEEANLLVKNHLKNEREFWAKYSLSTVSMAEASFNEKEMWRGPVWIAVNWFINKGLSNYGFTEEARAVRDSSIALLQNAGFREYFNPKTGEGLGATNFTWGGLVVDMEPQNISGV